MKTNKQEVKSHLVTERWSCYLDRAGRAEYIAASFAAWLQGSVLDVGCGDAHLRGHVASYAGLDISGHPDVIADLEQGGLPIRDDAVDTVVCTDVLEHIEPIRSVAGELFRVARSHVIVSIPNMYAVGWRLRFLRGLVLSKEYSLAPRNRHKWLPSYNECRSFIRRELPAEWTVRKEYGYSPQAWWRVGPVRWLLARRFPNLLATAYWAVLENTSR